MICILAVTCYNFLTCVTINTYSQIQETGNFVDVKNYRISKDRLKKLHFFKVFASIDFSRIQMDVRETMHGFKSRLVLNFKLDRV